MAGLRASGGHALVVPVQTAGLADLNDPADLRRLHSSRLRAVHLQGLVAAPAMVMGEVVFENPPQMPLAQHDDVVEAFATDAADQALDERGLLAGGAPGSPQRAPAGCEAAAAGVS